MFIFSANRSGFYSKILEQKKKENTNLYHGLRCNFVHNYFYYLNLNIHYILREVPK